MFLIEISANIEPTFLMTSEQLKYEFRYIIPIFPQVTCSNNNNNNYYNNNNNNKEWLDVSRLLHIQAQVNHCNYQLGFISCQSSV